MNRNERIFVAGGRGLVGSALVRYLKLNGYTDIITPNSDELDLRDQVATRKFFQKKKPKYVFLAAAKVGGIWANANYPAEFFRNNISIESNVIHNSYEAGVKKLLFLGSSCIYPKDSEIPIKESSLFTGPLETTNEAYAVAKIAGIKMCEYYRKQYGCDFISVMPTNTFGPNDNFDLKTAHMLASLIYKFHSAKINGEDSVMVWGTGKPRREIMYVDDIADACFFLMENYSSHQPINIGTGEDFSITEIAERIKKITDFNGEIKYDLTKPDGVYRKVMDVSRMLDLGWKPKVSLEAGLKMSYDWFVANYQKIYVYPSFKKKPFLFKVKEIASPIKKFLINPELSNKSLDSHETLIIHKKTLLGKPFLKKLYLNYYSDFASLDKGLKSVPGRSLELGSGGGFLKTLIPEIITSDVTLYPGVDQIENAYKLSFKDNELKAIYLNGVLHHLGKPREFFKEATRCLKPGGIIAMMEPHMSWFGRFFFKTLHHEGNDMNTSKWEFSQFGPLSDANTALPTIIFDRDFELFKTEFPELEIVIRKYHTFISYGLSGGVGMRFSAPGWFYPFVNILERALSPFMKTYLGTMQTILLRKRLTQKNMKDLEPPSLSL